MNELVSVQEVVQAKKELDNALIDATDKYIRYMELLDKAKQQRTKEQWKEFVAQLPETSDYINKLIRINRNEKAKLTYIETGSINEAAKASVKQEWTKKKVARDFSTNRVHENAEEKTKAKEEELERARAAARARRKAAYQETDNEEETKPKKKSKDEEILDTLRDSINNLAGMALKNCSVNADILRLTEPTNATEAYLNIGKIIYHFDDPTLGRYILKVLKQRIHPDKGGSDVLFHHINLCEDLL